MAARKETNTMQHEVLSDTFELSGSTRAQVKSADDAENRGPLGESADPAKNGVEPRVSTTANDDGTFGRAHEEGCVVEYGIGRTVGTAKVVARGSGGSGQAGNLTGEPDIWQKLIWFTRESEVKSRGKRPLRRFGHANGLLGTTAGIEMKPLSTHSRVTDESAALMGKLGKASGVIVMAMAEDNQIRTREIEGKCLCVAGEGTALAGVEEKGRVSGRLDQEREAVSADQMR